MIQTSALPFVIRRDSQVIRPNEITSTRENMHGLLHLDEEQLVIQWRTTREISRYGIETRTDREVAPLREVSIPLSDLAGARIRRQWRQWWFTDVLVLTAADMRAIDALTDDGETPGLVLDHPAEVVLDLRRVDRPLAQEFATALRLAISERLLASYDEKPPLLSIEQDGAAASGARQRSREKA